MCVTCVEEVRCVFVFVHMGAFVAEISAVKPANTGLLRLIPILIPKSSDNNIFADTHFYKI